MNFLFAEFPHVVGALDCTHVPIIAPFKNEDQYVDKDGNHSLKVQMIVNHRGAITHLSAHWPGSVHDLRILQESDFYHILTQHLLGNKFILGDSGYQCMANLLTPYPVADTEKEYFNTCLSQTCIKVECVFGQMKKKFQCLYRKPDYQPEAMCNIIRACCFLWNYGLICGDNKGYSPDHYVIEDHAQLLQDLGATPGGELVHNQMCNYLWRHK